MLASEHQVATAFTALYPEAGTGSGLAVTYLSMGLAGESAEALEKLVEQSPEVAAELGDVSWYLARLHSELGIVMDDGDVTHDSASSSSSLMAVVELQIAAGKVLEVVKKMIRDDQPIVATSFGVPDLTRGREASLVELVGKVRACWTDACTQLGLNPDEVRNANAEKLRSRKQRGCLYGSGDNR